MFAPHSFPVALLLMVASTICWGSWANTFKGAGKYRFELFYWDYAAGIFLTSLLLACTMGSIHGDSTSFFANLGAAGRSNLIYALAAGAVFNLANLLLVAGIGMAGLSIAFPVSIGIALAVGVLLSYLLQPRGNAALLALGVAFAIIAVILDGKAYAALGGAGHRVSRKSLAVCIVSGILMGLWAPLATDALTVPPPLGPYGAAVFFTLGALVSCFLFNTYLMRRPLAGEPVGFGGFLRAPVGWHLLGLAGGAIWGVGTVFNLVAANYTGVAISYAIGQAAPMVAALWGVFAWREFRGAGTKARTFLAFMFLFYVVAIVTVARATAG